MERKPGVGLPIDALELLYPDRPDASGIVSSDADFTPLVTHLRARDAAAYGYATLTKLLVAIQLFEIADEGKSTVMVRDKRQSQPGASNG